jgi:hypothetical protein
MSRRNGGQSYPGGGGSYPGGGGGGRRRGGGTSLYDAVFLASDELMKKQKGRKSLILLSDGVDNGSRLTLSECVESAQRADQPIDKVFASIEEDLRHQYSIGYTPTAAAPGYRHIHVAAKQKGLTVQAREGYYAL